MRRALAIILPVLVLGACAAPEAAPPKAGPRSPAASPVPSPSPAPTPSGLPRPGEVTRTKQGGFPVISKIPAKTRSSS